MVGEGGAAGLIFIFFRAWLGFFERAGVFIAELVELKNIHFFIWISNEKKL